MMNNNVGSSRQRHCMVVHNYYPLGEPRVEREALALANHGYAVDVICLQREGEPITDTKEGVRIYRLPVKRHRGNGLAVQLLEYLAFFSLAFTKLAALHGQRRYNVVQMHNLPDFLIFAGLVPKLTGARLILDVHDLMPEFYAGRFKSSMVSWPVRLVRWQEQLSCGFADHVITVSDHWRQTLIKRGVPAHKCSVVMNVADERVFKISENGNCHSADKGRFELIYHGTIVQRYGLDLAIQAVDQVRHDIPDIHLTILGRGNYVDTLVAMVQERNLHQHVTIYNEMRPIDELPAIIRASDLAIVPYRNDTFTDALLPTKLMEYAALGLPAIAARTTAIEAYFHDTMAEFFEPGDSNDLACRIHALYRSPERRTELAQGSKKFNDRYNWATIGREYVSLVERLGGR
jgi:glycosyltransferase involved in cell wall biosynthesis